MNSIVRCNCEFSKAKTFSIDAQQSVKFQDLPLGQTSYLFWSSAPQLTA